MIETYFHLCAILITLEVDAEMEALLQRYREQFGNLTN
jgi:hypothetical protein